MVFIVASSFYSIFVIAGIHEINDGSSAGFSVASYPVVSNQTHSSNSFLLVEEDQDITTRLSQSGFYNRAALFQFGNNKNMFITQDGIYNRFLLVQVAKTDNDNQNIASTQKGDVNATLNYQSAFQITEANQSDTANSVLDAFAALNLDKAKAVAENFVFAPELSSINIDVIENTILYLTRLQQDAIDNVRRSRSASTWFVKSGHEYLKKNEALGIVGYKQNISAVTAGGSFAVNAQSRMGVAVVLTQSDVETEKLLSNTDLTGYHISGFSSWSIADYYIDLILNTGVFDLSSARFSTLETVESNVDGQSYSGRVQLGYLLANERSLLSPFISLGYSYAITDGYQEKGNILLTQDFGEYNSARLLASCGVVLRDELVDLFNNKALSYTIRFEVEKAILDHREALESRFAFEPDAIVYTPLHKEEDIYGRLSVGVDLAATRSTHFSLMSMVLINKNTDIAQQYGLYGQLSIDY